MRISDWSSDVCSSDLLGFQVTLQRRREDFEGRHPFGAAPIRFLQLEKQLARLVVLRDMLWYARGGMTEQVGEDRLFFRRPMRLELVDQLFQQRSSAFGGCIGQQPFGKAALHAAISFQDKEYIHLLPARFQLVPKF